MSPGIPPKRFDEHTYAPVGHCIYCGTSGELTTEHIIPYGLGGKLKLPQSSCKPCAGTTGYYERVILRGELWAVRIYRALKSRRKHKDAPQTYELEIIRAGRSEIVELPPDEYPILLHFPIFPPPAVLSTGTVVSGIQVSGVITVSFGPKPEAVATRLGATQISVTNRQHPVEFGRVLAKIAFAQAAADGVLNLLESFSEIQEVILGREIAVGRYVGTLPDRIERHPGLLHRIELIAESKSGILMALIQLFSDSSAPTYVVVLGKLKSDPQSNIRMESDA